MPAFILLAKVSMYPWSVFAAETTITAAKKLLIILSGKFELCFGVFHSVLGSQCSQQKFPIFGVLVVAAFLSFSPLKM